MNEQVQVFIDFLRAEASVAADVDAPAAERGEWWIDLKVDGLRTNVSWQLGRGFGIYSSEADYGARPQELFRDPAQASARVLQLAAQWRKKKKLSAMRLRELRHLVGATQAAVAGTLGGDQGRVSRVENGDDMKLSTLVGYLEALGGTLEIKAHFSSFDVPIEPVDFAVLKRRSKHHA